MGQPACGWRSDNLLPTCALFGVSSWRGLGWSRGRPCIRLDIEDVPVLAPPDYVSYAGACGDTVFERPAAKVAQACVRAPQGAMGPADEVAVIEAVGTNQRQTLFMRRGRVGERRAYTEVEGQPFRQ